MSYYAKRDEPYRGKSCTEGLDFDAGGEVSLRFGGCIGKLCIAILLADTCCCIEFSEWATPALLLAEPENQNIENAPEINIKFKKGESTACLDK